MHSVVYPGALNTSPGNQTAQTKVQFNYVSFYPIGKNVLCLQCTKITFLHRMIFILSCMVEDFFPNHLYKFIVGTKLCRGLHARVQRRGSPVVRTLAYHAAGSGLIPGLGGENY